MASDSLGKRQAALVRQWEGAVRRRAIRDGEDTGKEQTARITARTPRPCPALRFHQPMPIHCAPLLRHCHRPSMLVSSGTQRRGPSGAGRGAKGPKEKVLAAESSGRVFIDDVYSVGACNITSLILCSLLLFSATGVIFVSYRNYCQKNIMSI